MTAIEKEEIEINEENFKDYFKDIRKGKFEKGDIIAQYSASAEFIDGGEKRQVISLLTESEGKMEATAQVMRKLLFASEIDSYKIPRKMADDLISGMSVEDCAKKPYKYTLEMFFYTKPEYVPQNDPHWSVISVIHKNYVKTHEFSIEENDNINKKMKSLIDSRLLSEEESKEMNDNK
jgi:hypothetical protein